MDLESRLTGRRPKTIAVRVPAPIVLAVVAAASALGGCSQVRQNAPSAVPMAAAGNIGTGAHRRTSAENIFVANQTHEGPPWAGQVLVYPVGSNGNVPPTQIIGGSNTLLTQANGIVVNAAGEIFVANSDANTIVGFPVGSTGNVSPNVVIGGSNTGLASPLGLAIDNAGDLYVANCGTSCAFGPPGPTSIEEFAAGANGNIAPIRVISGKRTGFGGQIKGIALDQAAVVSVAGWTAGSAVSFGPHENGDVFPLRTIAGAQKKSALQTASRQLATVSMSQATADRISRGIAFGLMETCRRAPF